MVLHPCGEPLGAAFIVAKGTVRGVPDAADLIFADVAEGRDFFAGEEEPGKIPGELEKLLLIELHDRLL
jgi:hypothetical protein